MSVISVLLACASAPLTSSVTSVAIPMRDGVRLAADIVRPAHGDPAPTVLVQARYWRSFALRVPDPPGEPPVGPDQEVIRSLVAGGYAVVVIDVRGTGASEGDWRFPWSGDEIADSGEVIDWIIAQPWADGRVGTYGVSYGGTAALLAAANGRPALRAALAREIEWEPVTEIVAPGGVRNVAFVEAWADAVAALDRGRLASFFPFAAQWLATGPRLLDDDPRGAGLAARLAARQIADVRGDLAGVRAPSDRWGAHVEDGIPLRARDVGPAALVDRLAAAPTAIGVWGSWFDAATAVAVSIADTRLPNLVDARIGAWDHEGTGSASPFAGDHATVAPADVTAFFDAHLRGTSARRFRWFEVGADVWREGRPETATQTWTLGADGTLSEAPPAALRFVAPIDHTSGPNNRWTAGLLRPVRPVDATRAAPGLHTWTTAALTEDLDLRGAPRWACPLVTDRTAAVHAYLDALLTNGGVVRLSEGVGRLDEGAGPADALPLLPIAAHLPSGSRLRLGVAAADTDTFERLTDVAPVWSADGCALQVVVGLSATATPRSASAPTFR